MSYPTLSQSGIQTLLTAATLTKIAPDIKMAIRDTIIADAPQVFTEHKVNTICRIAHAFAQFKKETGGLKRLDENLRYSTAARLMHVWPNRFPTVASATPYLNNPEKLGNFVYANRNGNGPESSGDGFTYRGSGLIQLTGRGNFRMVGELIGVDDGLEEDPDSVRKPGGALLVAAGYWTGRAINEVADGDTGADVDRVTRRVNPYESAAGKQERRDNFAAILQILKDSSVAMALAKPVKKAKVDAQGLLAVVSGPEIEEEQSTEPALELIEMDRKSKHPATRKLRAMRTPAVYWPTNDANSPDYSHLAQLELDPADQGNFDLTPDDIELLIRANAFAVPADQKMVTIALRGATIGPEHEMVGKSSIACFDARPDHRNFRCLLGFLDRESRQLTLFSGSTVPCPYYMLNYYFKKNGLPYNSTVNCNMLPSGSYVFRVAAHDKGKIKPALRMSDLDSLSTDATVCVWRTSNDVTFGIMDPLDDPAQVYDNVHCSYFEEYSGVYDSHFSSAGCLTVRGRKKPTAQWKRFQGVLKAIGFDNRTDMVLLTGKEAALASELRRKGLATDTNAVRARIGRLRAGSTGDGVKKIQQRLGIGQTGYFGPVTAKAFHTWQIQNGHVANAVYSPDTEARTGWGAL